ncbi:DUF4113 domain-containing protein [Billgrantia diversa]|uniref:DUF4113 domain-containing protein n=1 Tax=Halomonas sp. MCCC 1A13316 TaxID=2733487 RepID=UPI0018A52CBF|nr:DUF4113 domain-containing protein [Halomonas sp. MCCC 1A13316]QOR40229.1 DUF4113 domain-containing protein [Halomonas sp. MCCC 1A13316]
MKTRLWKDVKMPVGVGIAPSKTLAKLANHAAKKIPKCQGVCVLDEPHKWEWLLRRTPVTGIWGIAKRLGRRLADLQIYSAWDLAIANPKIVRRASNVNLERTIEELNGRACLALEEVPPAKKQIYCTRSFGKKATELQPCLEAVSLYASRAAEKLRAQRHIALAMHVFMHTSPFEPNFHSVSNMARLPYPTDDTREIVALARAEIARLYRPGHAFMKAGIGLVEVADKRFYQHDLLHGGQSERSVKLMETLDTINRSQGKGAVILGAQGISKPWAMRQKYKSPEYTTRWDELPVVR